MPQRQVSPERKAVFYIGCAVSVVGFVCFISVFFTFVARFGDFTDFEVRVRSLGARALVGIVMIGIGKWMAGIGRVGLAGSGITLGTRQPDEELPLDERLRRLQKMRDDRLISEQDYESTRKRILESA